jgi:hypothetical protein
MKTNQKLHYHAALITVVVLALLAGVYPVRAAAIYMNFDSVDVTTSVDATSYLASFGITITNATLDGVPKSGSVLIFNDQHYYSGNVVVASSPHNFLEGGCGSTSWSNSYTLNFSTPLESLSFTRIAYTTGGGAQTPGWNATAYIGATAIGSVGSPNINQDYAAPAHTYAFSGAGITSLTITGYEHNTAALSSVPLDDFYMTPVLPEPATLLLVGLGGLVLRKRRA